MIVRQIETPPELAEHRVANMFGIFDTVTHTLRHCHFVTDDFSFRYSDWIEARADQNIRLCADLHGHTHLSFAGTSTDMALMSPLTVRR